MILFLCIYFLIVCVCMCDRERGEEGEREAGIAVIYHSWYGIIELLNSVFEMKGLEIKE